MSKNIKQVYDNNPSTSLGNDDLLYAGQSPYGLTDDTAIKFSDLKTQVNTSIPGSEIVGNISGNAANVTGVVAVANGGTGANTLTGYVKGNGTSVMTASATIPGSDISGNISGNASNVTGTVAVANGGSGATTLTGFIRGNGTSAFTAVTNIPLTNGGLNASLTASNGGIFYSTASEGAILAGTSTPNRMLLSGASAAPTWSANTISLGGAFITGGAVTFSGAFTLTATLTANTSVTFPTSGTLFVSPLTTKGDILGYSTTNIRFPVGTDGQVLIADSTQTSGLRWGTNASSALPSVSVTGTSKTFSLSDANTFQNCSNVAAQTLTIPADASVNFPVDTVIEGSQTGTGVLSITPAGGVTLNSQNNARTIALQYGVFSLKKLAANSWLLSGDLTA